MLSSSKESRTVINLGQKLCSYSKGSRTQSYEASRDTKAGSTYVVRHHVAHFSSE